MSKEENQFGMEAQKKGAASRPFQPVRESIDWLEQVKAERAKALEVYNHGSFGDNISLCNAA
jgi:hypothetical protein